MIAEKIKALREARSWTQAELARRMGITRNGVNSWEQGLSIPSPASIVELAKTFSVSTDYLLGGGGASGQHKRVWPGRKGRCGAGHAGGPAESNKRLKMCPAKFLFCTGLFLY